MLAVAACESSGAAAFIQAGLRVLASPPVLKEDKNKRYQGVGRGGGGGLTWHGRSLQAGQFVTPVELRRRSLKITSSPWMTSWRTQPGQQPNQDAVHHNIM